MSVIIKTTTHARIGFLGNPSDGYNGKTISFPLRNFKAETVLWASDTLKFILNNEDQDEYSELGEMVGFLNTNGYYGGIRLIKAAIVSLHKFCDQTNIKLPKKNFTVSYRSNIPRQSGLAGSSAIIISTLKSLISFYQIDNKKIPPAILANIALRAETEELGIAAGLQDRVVQSYNQPVFMDFSPEAFKKNDNKYGNYQTLESSLLPAMLVAWNNRPSESGKFHSNIKARFQSGDSHVITAMNSFASIAEDGYMALKKGDRSTLHSLVDANFNLRRELYGDMAVGLDNIKMIELARKMGAAAKFPGSGGAILILPKFDRDTGQIIKSFISKGYNIERIKYDEEDN